MTIGTILEKLGKGEPLDPLEIKELRLFGDQTQTNNAILGDWITPGSKDPHFRTVSAESANLSTMVGNPVVVFIFDTTGAAAELAIADDTITPLDLKDSTVGDIYTYYEDAYPLIRFDSEKIFLRDPYKIFDVSGSTSWNPSATGARIAYIQFYNAATDALVTRYFLHQFAGLAGGGNVIPFTMTMPFFESTGLNNSDYYMRFCVYQGSGGPLNLTGYNITFSLVK